MIEVAGFTFPESREELDNWNPEQYRRMLHRQVMVVARTRIERRWKAYCFPVPGLNHDDEEYLWESEGVAIPEAVARALFPFFKDLKYSK